MKLNYKFTVTRLHVQVKDTPGSKYDEKQIFNCFILVRVVIEP